jgi:hypothetical protein
MVVLRRIVDLKYDCHLREKAFDCESGEVGFSIKHQPVSSAGKWFAYQKKGLDSSIIVRPGMAEFGPAFVCILRFQINLDATRGRAA